MKKYTKLFCCFLFSLSLILVGCNTQNLLKNISNYDWKIEFITDLSGNVLVTSSNQPDLAEKEIDLILQFDDNGFFKLLDLTDNKNWNGTYSLESADKENSSYKLGLNFTNTKTSISGVLGERKYQDKTEVPTITLKTASVILSFIASE